MRPGGIGSFVTPWFRLFSSKGACLSLVTAVLGSISLNFDKMAVLQSNPMILSGSEFLSIGVFLYAIFLINGHWRKNLDKSCFWSLFLVGLLVGAANVLMNSGFLHGIVPYVGSLKRTQIIWTTLLAGIFLNEKYTGSRLIAAVIIVVGVILLAL